MIQALGKNINPRVSGTADIRGAVILELLIATLVALFVIAGVLVSYSGAKVSYATSNNIGSIQDIGRFALHVTSEEARLAGFWGINSLPSAIQQTNTSTKGYGCGAGGWVTDITQPILVLESPTAAQLPNCVPEENFVSGTDLLMVRNAASPLQSTSEIKKSSVYLHAGVYQGKLFEAEQDGEVPSSADFTEFPSTVVYPFNFSLYYLQPCADPGEDAKCDDQDDEGDPVPTLVRVRLEGDQMEKETIARHIENFQILVGSESGTGGVVSYQRASSTTDWDDVRSLEVNFLVQAPGLEADYQEDEDGSADPFSDGDRGSYTFAGQSFTFTDQRRRQVYTSTIYLRNDPSDNAL